MRPREPLVIEELPSIRLGARHPEVADPGGVRDRVALALADRLRARETMAEMIADLLQQVPDDRATAVMANDGAIGGTGRIGGGWARATLGVCVGVPGAAAAPGGGKP